MSDSNSTIALSEIARIRIPPKPTEMYDIDTDKVRPVIQIGWVARFVRAAERPPCEYSIQVQDDIWLVAAKDIEL